MGLDVVLVRTERVVTGTKKKKKKWQFVQLDVYADTNEDFLRDCGRAQRESSVSTDVPMLVRLEPFGLTVLTREDMEQFASEVTRLREVDRSSILSRSWRSPSVAPRRRVVSFESKVTKRHCGRTCGDRTRGASRR